MAVDLSSPGARTLFEYWVRGEGAAKIRWGTDGSFDRCVRHLSGKVRDPKGLCAEYHKAATGEWPAEKGVESAAETVPFALGIRLGWRGLLAPIGKPTGDGREFARGALTHRELPLPLTWQRMTKAGSHDGAVIIGSMQHLIIGSDAVVGGGELFSVDEQTMPRLAEDLAESQFLLEKGVIGPSVELDDFTFSWQNNKAVVSKGRISAATLLPVPAFAEARAFEIFEITDEGVGQILLACGSPFELITLRQWLESKHPRDFKGRFRETPDAPAASASGAQGPATTMERPKKKSAPRKPSKKDDKTLEEARLNQLVEENVQLLFSHVDQFEGKFPVRSMLMDAKSTTQVSNTTSALIRQLTGRDVFVGFEGFGLHASRSYAEGMLRVLELFPQTPLRTARGADIGGNVYAHAFYDGVVEFNRKWGKAPSWKKLQQSCKSDTEDGFHVPGAEDPATIAVHEVAHVLHFYTDGVKNSVDYFRRAHEINRLAKELKEHVDPHLTPPGMESRKRGFFGISQYADKNLMEMVAEAMTDVITNGSKAGPGSQAVFRVILRRYMLEGKRRREQDESA